MSPNSERLKRRVISLAPSLTEWLFAFNASEQLVGRSASSDYPLEVSKTPSVGGLFPPDLELILARSPTDALMIDGHEDLKANLKRFGVRVHTLQPHSLKEHWEVAGRLASLLGREAEGGRLIERQTERLAHELKRLKETTSPHLKRAHLKVLIEVWPRPLMVAGAESFMGDLVRVAGGDAIPKGLGEWPQLTLSQLITLDPDVLLVASEARAQELLTSPPSALWGALRAVKTGRVYAREGRLERPGPRLVDELLWLAQLLYK